MKNKLKVIAFVVLAISGVTATVLAMQEGFTASTKGAKNEKIASPGLFFCVQGHPSSIGQRPDYYVIADGVGLRPIGITFSIPASTRPGTYKLAEISPLDEGEKIGVRVDLSAANFFRWKTQGVLILDSVPDPYGKKNLKKAKGSFKFHTENEKGERIEAEGAFSFLAPSDLEKYCKQ